MNPVAWLRKLLLVADRLRRLVRLRRHHPFFFGSVDRAAYRVLSDGIFRGLRAPYLLGVVVAAVQARMVGVDCIVLLEFGVASGGGLRELGAIADLVERHMNVATVVVGFDSGKGLPQPQGAIDHPELWSADQFLMLDRHALTREFASPTRRLILGSIDETLEQLDGMTGDAAPIGFVSIDVDLYSSTTPILNYLAQCPATRLLPASVVHCDDTYIAWTYSALAGEERAIEEFNSAQDRRRLDLKDRDLRLFALNCLDHPIRTGYAMPVEKLTIVVRQAASFV